MGWKGTVRSIGAAVRQAEREAKRRQRELERQRREYEKLAALERAQLEVAEYENYVERLVTVHEEVTAPVDWNALHSAPEPRPPDRKREAEYAARQALETYRPSVIDKLFGRQQKKLAALQEGIMNCTRIMSAVLFSGSRAI